MNKKRAEGKPYRVYMMASANKFLRIYYATVKAYLESLEHTARPQRKTLAGRRFIFEVRSGLVWYALFLRSKILEFYSWLFLAGLCF